MRTNLVLLVIQAVYYLKRKRVILMKKFFKGTKVYVTKNYVHNYIVLCLQ